MLASNAFAKEKLGGMQFLIIRKHFSQKCGEACNPSASLPPQYQLKLFFCSRSWADEDSH